MAAIRAVAPLTSSSSAVFRFASSTAALQVRPCQHLVRTFTSSQAGRQSSKRKMQTSSAYTAYSFDPAPPPPARNTGTPDTSIAKSLPQLNETRPPPMQSSVSERESEAQRSRPVAASTAASAPTTQTRPKTRPKLKARKAAMKLTAEAVSQLRALLDQPEPKLIKVGVKNRGCSGLAYHLEYVEKPGMFDETVEQDGVKVLIDSKALFSIIGSEMDWVEDKLSARFVFKNPNIKEQCGCGESFMV